MSNTGNNDPYDPNRPPGGSDPTPPPPPPAPQWGSNPPPEQQFGAPQYGGQQYGGQQYGGQQYGGSSYGQPAGTPPPNYLVWAILSTLFCCLPLGIASIVFAAQVNSKHAAGDHAGAQESSQKAKKFAIWSAAVGFILLALYIVFVVVLAVGSDTTS